MDKEEIFLNQTCKLQQKDGFILHGTVIEITETGIVFKTAKKTSYIGFCDIAVLIPEDDKL